MNPASPEPEPHPPLPEFIEGSSSSANRNPQPDVDGLAHRLYAAASFNDNDNLWKEDDGDMWSF